MDTLIALIYLFTYLATTDETPIAVSVIQAAGRLVVISENVLNRASILLSNRIQSFFFHCAMDFRNVSMVTSFHLFLIASLMSCRDLQTEDVGLRTPNPAGYPKCSKNKKPSYCWDSQPSVGIFRT